MGYEVINRKTNQRIQEIAEKIELKKHTETERNELATLVYPKLRIYIWGFCKNNLDTEEALQWSVKKIFKNIAQYKSVKAKFTTWMHRIAHNETLFYLYMKNKKQHVSIEKFHSPINIIDDFDEVLERHTTIEDVYSLTLKNIHSIEDELMKNIAIDKMLKKKKVKQIADTYSINENTVKTKLRKIRADIKKDIYNQNPGIKEKIEDLFVKHPKKLAI